MKLSRALLTFLLAVLLVGCGDTGSGRSEGPPESLPVGPTTWDATAPAWLLQGTLHVGERSVELGDQVESFVLGATGVYWLRGYTLMFTSAEGRTERVSDGRWGSLAVSADRTVLAAEDRSHGPTDEYGTHVIQAAVFDTRSGDLIYRTPDREPDKGADLTDLYEETSPLLHGVSSTRLFFDDETVDLADGSTSPVTEDDEGLDVYPGFAETLFADGFHVGVKGEGTHRELAGSGLYGVARLSPERSTIFDATQWPALAVAYDAATGNQRAIEAPWDHFNLVGFTGEDRFFGVAQKIDEDAANIVRAQQVVLCQLPELTCTAVSPVIPAEDPDSAGNLRTEDTGSSF